jgi:aspartyl protease family protein
MTENPGDQAKYPQKLGGTMTLLAWIVLLGMLTLVFGDYLDRQTNPNPVIASQEGAGGTEVILYQNRGGHYIATATINGGPVEVMLDTGATDVSVPAGIADRLGLARGPQMEVGTANGTIHVYATLIDSIQLGELALHGIRANINPYMDDDFVLLGMSFLKRIEFSQRQGQLILRQPGSQP